ncbi:MULTISPECIES: DUF2971 domain-containing protein [Pseudomonas]|uniref:DUF2971 domain-containing protein n=1 Tax=Pseudomonas TaxID=286 RepID=UPI000F0006C4|nr:MULTISPECIES: DUF2971 domain-containing protein [Pseudomonas]
MILYHYTDQNGFMGIFQQRELWATKIQFLNDSNEHKLALDLAAELLESYAKKSNDRNVKARLNHYKDSIPHIKDRNVCVCSLTENGDLLSQWRGYSQSHGGYSIGLNYYALEPYIRLQGFKLVQCIYSKKEQVSVVSKMIEALIEEFKDEPEPEYGFDISYESTSTFLDRLSEIAPVLKDPSFEEEAEWRIIVTASFRQLSFRAGKSMLTPFYKVSLRSSDDDKFRFLPLVQEVVVGHTPHPELAVLATEAFLINMFPPRLLDGDYSTLIEVRKTSIPFRNW